MFIFTALCNYLSYRFFNLKKALVVITAALLLSACQLTPTEVKTASNSGFGGTGKTADQTTQVAKTSGFGGTGQVASNSGFGGTGIIGTITEFGSIWVNGVEVEYSKNVKVTSNLSTKETLQLGQQVVVETELGHKQPWANTIQVFYPLAGLVEKVEDNLIVVDGHTVIINKQTRIADGLNVKAGEMVAVNGYPDNDNRWVATRLSYNTESKHIYQVIPDVHFSNKVNNVIIETNKTQLSDWNKVFSGLNINLIENSGNHKMNQKYLLKADVNNGKITGYHLHDYYRMVKNQKVKQDGEFNNLKEIPKMPKGGQIKKPLEPLEIKEAHETLIEQKTIIQNQLEQMYQLQEIKDNIQNINELRSQMPLKK
ncbi:DUF5666 domain-containing protein [Thiomicrorhabdus sp.]|uniref:DUF5666 domain-containing protein n=1 Tax=Thiomicrorhabdus sp. TaxID=2039724 RepID=UPI002AA7F127|nr:DUF5666 domain-containing protein [Thiomicrorhabdus sp.]